jgi:hypothetical protein
MSETTPEIANTTQDTWELYYAFSEHGRTAMDCDSLEDCASKLATVVEQAGKLPLWAKAVHTTVRTTTAEYPLVEQ